MKNYTSAPSLIMLFIGFILSYGYNFLKNQGNLQTLTPLSAHDLELFKSIQLSKKDADQLITDYGDRSNSKRLKVNVDSIAGSKRKSVLKGFTFDIKHIEDIIHSNQSLVNLGVVTTLPALMPDSLIIYFGKEKEFDEEGKKHPNMRMIIMGGKIINGDFYKLDKNKNDNPTMRVPGAVSIYDKATPCPTNCPKSL